MGRIRKIKDIVDWGLCIGCGACAYYCDKDSVEMKNVEHIGIRPFFNEKECANCEGCLHICPGHSLVSKPDYPVKPEYKHVCTLIGPVLRVWEGHATDTHIRFNASSGGAVSALAQFCLEKKGMALVLHVGMNSERPWENMNVVSKNKNQLIQNAGSRYQTSSVCESLKVIEESDKQCVFIGRPCDAAAVNMLRKVRPQLDKNLGLVLSFFCAGTPSTHGTKELLSRLKIKTADVKKLRYRGEGWPGGFDVHTSKGTNTFIPYMESWAFLTKYRPFRCQICPDGLGELADITCGDSWHKFDEKIKSDGRSLVLARNKHGQTIVTEAIQNGYIALTEADPVDVVKAQGLVGRRKEIFGRILAMKMLFVPVTGMKGFYLFANWYKISFKSKIISVFGTIRRLISRGLWHKNVIQDD